MHLEYWQYYYNNYFMYETLLNLCIHYTVKLTNPTFFVHTVKPVKIMHLSVFHLLKVGSFTKNRRKAVKLRSALLKGKVSSLLPSNIGQNNLDLSLVQMNMHQIW